MLNACIKFLFTNDSDDIKNNLDSDTIYCSNAAKSGNYEALIQLHKNNYPWDEWTCYYAAKNGNIELIDHIKFPT